MGCVDDQPLSLPSLPSSQAGTASLLEHPESARVRDGWAIDKSAIDITDLAGNQLFDR